MERSARPRVLALQANSEELGHARCSVVADRYSDPDYYPPLPVQCALTSKARSGASPLPGLAAPRSELLNKKQFQKVNDTYLTQP